MFSGSNVCTLWKNPVRSRAGSGCLIRCAAAIASTQRLQRGIVTDLRGGNDRFIPPGGRPESGQN